MPKTLRRLIPLDRGTNQPPHGSCGRPPGSGAREPHPQSPIPRRGGSCGRPPGGWGAGTTSPLQPRLPRAPTRGAPTGGRPPGLGDAATADLIPLDAVLTTPHTYPNPLRRLILLDRGTNHPTPPQSPIPPRLLWPPAGVGAREPHPQPRLPRGALLWPPAGVGAREPHLRCNHASPIPNPPVGAAGRPPGSGAREPHLRCNHATPVGALSPTTSALQPRPQSPIPP